MQTQLWLVLGTIPSILVLWHLPTHHHCFGNHWMGDCHCFLELFSSTIILYPRWLFSSRYLEAILTITPQNEVILLVDSEERFSLMQDPLWILLTQSEKKFSFMDPLCIILDHEQFSWIQRLWRHEWLSRANIFYSMT